MGVPKARRVLGCHMPHAPQFRFEPAQTASSFSASPDTAGLLSLVLAGRPALPLVLNSTRNASTPTTCPAAGPCRPVRPSPAQRVTDFQWLPGEPWTVISVSDNSGVADDVADGSLQVGPAATRGAGTWRWHTVLTRGRGCAVQGITAIAFSADGAAYPWCAGHEVTDRPPAGGGLRCIGRGVRRAAASERCKVTPASRLMDAQGRCKPQLVQCDTFYLCIASCPQYGTLYGLACNHVLLCPSLPYPPCSAAVAHQRPHLPPLRRGAAAAGGAQVRGVPGWR